MVDKVPQRVHGEGGAGERYCVLCREEEGKPNEPARRMMMIRPRSGGRQRRVAVCLAHADRLGGHASPYEVIAEPPRSISSRGSVRPREHVQGKSAKGDINRTLRRVGRYSKTQRGRLGE